MRRDRSVVERGTSINGAVVCLLVVLAHPSSGSAQGAGDPRVEPGDRIRVSVEDGRGIEGSLIRVGPGSLVVADENGVEHALSQRTVRQVWRWRSRTASFAKGGAFVGGLGFGTFSAILVHRVCDSSSCTESTAKTFLAASMAGALGGVALGAFLGSIASGWEEIASDFGASRSSTSWSVHVGPPSATSGAGSAFFVGVRLTVATAH